MSAPNADETGLPAASARMADPKPRPTGDETHSPDGVDVTLVRWMLGLTPAERLQVLQDAARSLGGLRGAATHR